MGGRNNFHITTMFYFSSQVTWVVRLEVNINFLLLICSLLKVDRAKLFVSP